MKEYFKYEKGYVNINEENLFLTNSGNWSETATIAEKSPITVKQNTLKSYKYGLFYVILIALGFYVNIINKSVNYRFTIALFVLGVLAYFYLKRETGSKYKIPLSKISNIVILHQQAKIIFTNADNMEDYEIITHIEPKGIKILECLLIP